MNRRPFDPDLLTRQFTPPYTVDTLIHAARGEPPNLDAPISEPHRVHEIARLKVRLRETINKRRQPIRSDYLGNEEMRLHKAMLARNLLDNGGNKRQGIDYGALETYADARNLPLPEAAQQINKSLAAAWELQIQTEGIKDQLLAQIEAIQSLRDIEAMDQILSELEKTE